MCMTLSASARTCAGRHLDEDNTDARPAEFLVKVGAVIAQKLLNNARFAHARRAVDDQTRDAVAWWVVDQIRQALENALGARILDPSLPPNPGDALHCSIERRPDGNDAVFHAVHCFYHVVENAGLPTILFCFPLRVLTIGIVCVLCVGRELGSRPTPRTDT